MTTIEHKELKGITLKNIIVTIISTASIVISVMTTYFQLKQDISDVKNQNDTEKRVNNIRLGVIEGQVALLQQEVNALKEDKSTNRQRPEAN